MHLLGLCIGYLYVGHLKVTYLCYETYKIMQAGI